MISAIILVKNGEKTIVRTLSSVLWCDEIIVIDDCSTDRTKEKIKEFDSRVKKIRMYRRTLSGDFSVQRNFGLSKAREEWVLFLDVDEVVPDRLGIEIRQRLTDADTDGYSGFFLRRRDYLWGKSLRFGETGRAFFLRLGRKHAGKWKGEVHEVWEIPGSCPRLKTPLDHYPHPTIREFLEEINRYTSLRVPEDGANHTVSLPEIALYPIGKFGVNYFLRLGFLDGMPGLLVAAMMSFHSFLVRAKRWKKETRKKKE